MGRFCYCSQILASKSDVLREHWKHKSEVNEVEVADFWDHLKMTGFECWLQKTPQGDFLIHCLEGESLQYIFKGFREQMELGNATALDVQNLYQNVLGKNYASPDAEPQIECLLDISLPSSSSSLMRRGFVYPLLPNKEEEHRRFRLESMGAKRTRHEASMKAFGITRLSSWLQDCHGEKYMIIYSEGSIGAPKSSSERLHLGEKCPEWKEIAAHLIVQTGLNYDQLSPEIEWLSAV